MFDGVVSKEEMKKNLNIHEEESDFDDLIKNNILAVEAYMATLCKEKYENRKPNQYEENIARVVIIAMGIDLFENRGLTVDGVRNKNKIVDSLLITLMY